MRAQERLKDLAEAPLGRLLVRFSWPALVSMSLNALYAIIDRVYVGHGCGQDAMAGITLAFPIMMLFGAFGVFVGAGHAALLSIKLGEGDRTACEKILGELVAFKLAFFCVLPPLVFLFLDPILRATGGDGVTPGALEQAKVYLRIVLFSHVFSHLAYGLSATMRSEGAVVPSMMCMVVGFGVNLVLDPIFIFGLRWGMMGAAVATVIGQVATAILSFWYLLHMRIIRPRAGDYRIAGDLCTRMLTLGMTSFLSQISLVAAMAAINNMIRKYGALDPVFGQEQYAQIPMAVVGIVMKFFQIVISIVVGMAAGCIPIVGFNMGAGKSSRVKALFTSLLISEAIVGAVALVLVEAFPRQLIALFGAANESSYYTDFALRSFRIYLCMIILACVNKACFIFLQAMGKAAESTALSMVREVVFGVGFALLLPVFFGLNGVLYSMPLSDILTFIIAAYLIVKTYHQLSKDMITSASGDMR